MEVTYHHDGRAYSWMSVTCERRTDALIFLSGPIGLLLDAIEREAEIIRTRRQLAKYALLQIVAPADCVTGWFEAWAARHWFEVRRVYDWNGDQPPPGCMALTMYPAGTWHTASKKGTDLATVNNMFELGRVAYEGYAHYVSWKSPMTGDELPPWGALNGTVQYAWAAAAQGVLQAKWQEPAAKPQPAADPHITAAVHYVSFGTPAGEYTSMCRAAIIADVPPLTADDAQDCAEGIQPRDRVDLVVLNPGGLFFNRCSLSVVDQRGGTWHWPHQCKTKPTPT